MEIVVSRIVVDLIPNLHLPSNLTFTDTWLKDFCVCSNLTFTYAYFMSVLLSCLFLFQFIAVYKQLIDYVCSYSNVTFLNTWLIDFMSVPIPVLHLFIVVYYDIW